MIPLILSACHMEAPGGNQSRNTNDGVPDYGRYEDWEPETKVVYEPVDEAEALRKAREYVENMRRAYGLPDDFELPEFVRWTEPNAGFEQIVKCVQEQGYPVKFTAYGSMSYKSDGELYSGTPTEIAILKCEAMYPVRELALPQSDDFNRVRYEYYTSFFVPCAQAHGVEFVSEPPPKEVWVEQITGRMEFDGQPWYPVTAGPDWSVASSNRFDEDEQWTRQLFIDCPMQPPVKALYGTENP